MPDLVSILLAADEDLFVEFLGCFPPTRYDLFFAAGLADARIHYQDHRPRLIVARLDGAGWQLTSLLREARAERIAILGVTDGSDATWVPSMVDRVVPVAKVDEVIAAACALVEERRRWPRAEVQLAVDLGEGQYAVASASSAGAMFIPMAKPLDRGESVEMIVHYEGNEMCFLATVIRVGAGEGGEKGMVLGVPDGASRRQLDAVVRREMMSEHFRRATHRSDGLPATISKKIAARSRNLLADAFTEAAASSNEAVTRPERKIIFALDSLKAIALPDDIEARDLDTSRSAKVEVAADLTGDLSTDDRSVERDTGELERLSPQSPPVTAERSHATPKAQPLRELAALSERVEQLERFCREEADRKLAQIAQQDAATAVIDSLAERMDALDGSIDRLAERMSALQQPAADADDLRRLNESIESSRHQLQQQLDNQRGITAAAGDRVEALSHRLTQQSQQASNLDQQLGEQASTIEIIKEQLVHQRSVLIAFQNDLERLERERLETKGQQTARRSAQDPLASLRTEEDASLALRGRFPDTDDTKAE